MKRVHVSHLWDRRKRRRALEQSIQRLIDVQTDLVEASRSGIPVGGTALMKVATELQLLSSWEARKSERVLLIRAHSVLGEVMRALPDLGGPKPDARASGQSTSERKREVSETSADPPDWLSKAEDKRPVTVSAKGVGDDDITAEDRIAAAISLAEGLDALFQRLGPPPDGILREYTTPVIAGGGGARE
ncbi:hypothetical protein ACIBI7_51605 [Nonomuraea fuscirosea]|uniref:hypothetical protein n=1 Tax=Nonomuraea fuscirosea TaxID=1291556 RepID=UPI00378CD70C